MTITRGELRARGVEFELGTDEGILPFTGLSVEEFDLIHDAVGAPRDNLGHEWGKALSIGIGEGIKYVLTYSRKESVTEVILSAPHGYFGFPLSIKVIKSHEPSGVNEHQDGCPYSVEEWMVDEEGEHYWADDGAQVYDEESDTWSASPEHRVYEPECFCEYVEDETWETVLTGAEGSDSLDSLSEYLGVVKEAEEIEKSRAEVDLVKGGE